MVRDQCAPWPAAQRLPAPWSSSPASPAPWIGIEVGPPPTPAGLNWAGWHRCPHEFFILPRAGYIPRGREAQAFPEAEFKQFDHGGSHLEFTCEFKNYDHEIESFLDWIAPFVRLRYGKRRRGRSGVWVGWLRPDGAGRAYNIFIEPSGAAGPRTPSVRVRVDYD